jgi:hypothetical protein
MDFSPTFWEFVSIILIIIGSIMIGVGCAGYFGAKDEALIDFAEPFNEEREDD